MALQKYQEHPAYLPRFFESNKAHNISTEPDDENVSMVEGIIRASGAGHEVMFGIMNRDCDSINALSLELESVKIFNDLSDKRNFSWDCTAELPSTSSAEKIRCQDDTTKQCNQFYEDNTKTLYGEYNFSYDNNVYNLSFGVRPSLRSPRSLPYLRHASRSIVLNSSPDRSLSPVLCVSIPSSFRRQSTFKPTRRQSRIIHQSSVGEGKISCFKKVDRQDKACVASAAIFPSSTVVSLTRNFRRSDVFAKYYMETVTEECETCSHFSNEVETLFSGVDCAVKELQALKIDTQKSSDDFAGSHCGVSLSGFVCTADICSGIANLPFTNNSCTINSRAEEAQSANGTEAGEEEKN